MELKNKNIITIGLNKIGIEIAKGLIDEGAYVTAVDKEEKNVRTVTKYGKSLKRKTLGIICDATKKDQIKTMIQKTLDYFEKIDVLITNFWWNKQIPLANTSKHTWKDELVENLKAAFSCVKTVLIPMKKEKKGTIIHILSLSGYTGKTNEIPLGITSASLMGFSKAVTRSIGKKKIKVYAVAIPAVHSESFDGMYSQGEIKKLKEVVDLSKLITPKDVVEPVIQLASDKSKLKTGEIIIVSSKN